MKLLDAIESLECIYRNTGSRRDTVELVVMVHQPGTVGGTPCVAVDRIYAGFDWDANCILLSTSKPLSALSPEDLAAINKSAKDGQSWHAYQQQKKLLERIRSLECELAGIRRKQ